MQTSTGQQNLVLQRAPVCCSVQEKVSGNTQGLGSSYHCGLGLLRSCRRLGMWLISSNSRRNKIAQCIPCQFAKALYRWHEEGDTPPPPPPPPPPESISGQMEYEAERVIDRDPKRRRYVVNWAGHLKGAGGLVQEFWQGENPRPTKG
jgi:hypothetical protein